MSNKKNKILVAAFAAAALLTAAGCGTSDTATEKKTPDTGKTPIAESLLEKENPSQLPQERKEAPEEKRKLLESMTVAIESQFTGETFTDIPENEVEHAVSGFEECYLFSGRRSKTGKEYIAGVSLEEENPLEGMTCRNDGPPAEYVTSQFADGEFLLLEKSGQEDGGFSQLYDVLQTGERGFHYMLDVAQRGNTLIMPEKTPFLRVSMIKETIPVIEYIPLTKEEYTALKEDKEREQGDKTLLLCETKETVQKLWSDSLPDISKEAVRLARERSGYNAEPFHQAPFTKATLQIQIHGELREETISNREDVEKLHDLLGEMLPQTETMAIPSGAYEGTLLLTGQDNQVQTLHLGLQGESIVAGTSWFAALPPETIEKIWQQFSTIEGWILYGDQVSIQMNQDTYTEEDPSITFKLKNETGHAIDYVLSPIFYKKEGDSWMMLDSIAGFCGVTDQLDGQEKELAVPWKGAFETKGPGIYRLEIQVAPETVLRFAVGSEFTVEGD